MTDAPRDDLIRGLTEVRAEGDGNTMVGYPIVFDTWTEINSWEGRFRERIHPSALNKTLKERGSQVKVQFDHGMHPTIGSLPLGTPEVMRVDDIGMYAEVSLSHARDVQELIKPRISEGSIDGQSFRFSVKGEKWEKEDTDLPERTITELALFEFGPVTWPAYEATQVGIRGQAAFAAWMQQTPEERSKLMQQFHHEQPQREVIRIRSGAVVIDTPDTDVAESGDVVDEESSEHRDEPTDGHSSTTDAPADGHSSSETDETPNAQGRRMTPQERKEALVKVTAMRLRAETAAPHKEARSG